MTSVRSCSMRRTRRKPYERETSRSLDAKAAEELKSKGMTITEISSEERARMREKLKPVIEKHYTTISEALVQELTRGTPEGARLPVRS